MRLDNQTIISVAAGGKEIFLPLKVRTPDIWVKGVFGEFDKFKFRVEI